MSSPMRRTTGSAVMETLRGYGIDTIFGIPGTHNLELYRSLGALGIRAVTTRHEQGAGYGADGWSLQTGKPGVVVTTSGPGLLNALSAAGTAYCESRPMLIVSPGPALGSEGSDAGTLHETRDQLGAASSIVAHATRADSAAEAVEAVHEAFARFAAGRPRPEYLEIPLDVLEHEAALADDATTPRAQRPAPAPNAAQIAAAARLLRTARDPVILAGGGSTRAGEQLRALAELLAAPVVTTLNGKGVLDEHHELSLGSSLRLAAARDRAREADVLLVVGSKLGEAELWVDSLDAHGAVIRVDVLESQLHANQRAAVGVVGDSVAVLEAILAELGDVEPRDRAAASLDAAGVRERVHAESTELSPVNVRIAERIVAALPDDAIVATDSSQIAYWGLLDTLRVMVPGSTPYMATYATLGYGLPAALGASIASPRRPTFAVVGDGALMFSLQELMTVVEQRADVTVIVVDNGGYAEIRQNEQDAGIAPVGVDLVQPDWPALADAFGGTGRRATTAAELAAAIDAAVMAGGLQLIHIDQSTFSA